MFSKISTLNIFESYSGIRMRAVLSDVECSSSLNRPMGLRSKKLTGLLREKPHALLQTFFKHLVILCILWEIT